jgi:hypothetical protein
VSAKELTIFIPSMSSIETSLPSLAASLSMAADDLSPTPGLTYQFSARRGEGLSVLSLEYKRDDQDLIQEISQWERPSDAYKHLLQACQSSITIYYRNPAFAQEALVAIGSQLQDATKGSVVDNGLGCLLTLDAILQALHEDAQWSWERYEFPEMPGVAASEWR